MSILTILKGDSDTILVIVNTMLRNNKLASEVEEELEIYTEGNYFTIKSGSLPINNFLWKIIVPDGGKTTVAYIVFREPVNIDLEALIEECALVGVNVTSFFEKKIV